MNISFTPSQILDQSPVKIPNTIFINPVITSIISLKIDDTTLNKAIIDLPICSIMGITTGNTFLAKNEITGTIYFSSTTFKTSITVPIRLPILTNVGLIKF